MTERSFRRGSPGPMPLFSRSNNSVRVRENMMFGLFRGIRTEGFGLHGMLRGYFRKHFDPVNSMGVSGNGS